MRARFCNQHTCHCCRQTVRHTTIGPCHQPEYLFCPQCRASLTNDDQYCWYCNHEHRGEE